MAYHTPFAAQPPVASSGLPLTLISLDDWALVTLTGADRSNIYKDKSRRISMRYLLINMYSVRTVMPKGKCGVTYGCFIVVRGWPL